MASISSVFTQIIFVLIIVNSLMNLRIFFAHLFHKLRLLGLNAICIVIFIILSSVSFCAIVCFYAQWIVIKGKCACIRHVSGVLLTLVQSTATSFRCKKSNYMFVLTMLYGWSLSARIIQLVLRDVMKHHLYIMGSSVTVDLCLIIKSRHKQNFVSRNKNPADGDKLP